MSGIAQGLHTEVEPLVASSDPPIMDVVEYFIGEALPDLRQSAYALLGDLCIACFPVVRARLNTLVPAMIRQIHRYEIPDELSVCNNAIWALGEISLQLGPEIEPFVPQLLEVLVVIVNINYQNRGRIIKENAAITIGRLGGVCPNVVAPHLESFILNWCQALRDIRDNMEKESAFLGMCKMVSANPNGVVKHFAFLCDAIVSWDASLISQGLNEQFRALLVNFKQALGAQWAPMFDKMPTRVKERLHQRYQL
ncbi:hypothetical protein HDU76_006067 [Blyttiomyces sp. JEL0837]|nr:hypothetical protein HDU76_006067 [Blyttiomyces sp. JEL0837]